MVTTIVDSKIDILKEFVLTSAIVFPLIVTPYAPSDIYANYTSYIAARMD